VIDGKKLQPGRTVCGEGLDGCKEFIRRVPLTQGGGVYPVLKNETNEKGRGCLDNLVQGKNIQNHWTRPDLDLRFEVVLSHYLRTWLTHDRREKGDSSIKRVIGLTSRMQGGCQGRNGPKPRKGLDK